MKILLSFIFAAFALSAQAQCDFRPEMEKLVSLSGTTTVLLKELGLLNHSKLVGISVFNPIMESEYKGRVYPGGIFLSQNSFSDLSNGVILYDESRELKKILLSQKLSSREVKTRNITPQDTVKRGFNILNEFLIGCDSKIKDILNKVGNLESEISSKVANTPTMIFYLGAIRNNRAPEMLMVNDGIVKWLRESGKIKTYPSELAYVNWSAKILHLLPRNTIHVGIVDSGRKPVKEVKKISGKYTLNYPGALVPGPTQLEAFLFLFDNI